MDTDKYAAQKKYLNERKQLRVWVEQEKYDRFKALVDANGTSVYALVNQMIDRYLEENRK
ncbi:MAG: plasmid partition protein ParG [Firmicutes bacterium]|nr:plasmid partition protein ParG [Bacillota bacterium]